MTAPGKGGGNADKIASFFKGVVREVSNAADAFANPVAHYERSKEKKRLKENLKKYTAVMQRQQGNAQVHVLEGQGPLGSTTVVEDRGTEFRPEGVQISDDGTPFWDVAGQPLALINTRANIESFLTTHAQTRLVNTNLFAERGHEIHYLSGDVETVKIGVAVSVFRPISEKDRYNVINPVVAAVKLIGPQLAGLGAAAAQAVSAAPSAAASAARDMHGLVETALGVKDGVQDIVDPDGPQPLDIGEPIFIISFAVTAFAPANPKITTKRAHFTCKQLGKYWGVRIGDVTGELMGLVDGLAG